MEHGYSASYGEISLEPLTLSAALTARVFRNDARDMFVSSRVITEQQQREWYEGYAVKPAEYMFAVVLNGAVIGQVGLYDVDDDARTCEFGRLVLSRAYSGRGLGRQVVVAACAVAFSQLGMETVRLGVLEHNKAAIKIYNAVGFSETGAISLDDGRVEIAMELSRSAYIERWQ